MEKLSSAIDTFASNLENLRDFVSLLAPVLQTHQLDQLKRDAWDLGPLLLAMHELDTELRVDDRVRKKLSDAYSEHFDITVNEQGKGIRIRAKDAAHSEAFTKAFGRMTQRIEHTNLLYKSALISLVSAAEAFISRLLHTYYARFPDAAGTSEKTFSLEDLRGLGSIDEAAECLIDLKVENVLRQSFEEWVTFFRSKPKLSMNYLERQKDELVEIFQRRNLVIHNDGIVNRHYLSHVAEPYRKTVEIGKQIKVTSEYIDKAITAFERNFILIGAELWKKLAPEDDARGRVLVDIAFKHLCAERWVIAESLSLFTAQDQKLSEAYKMIGKVNYWQALKWQGRFDEVQNDVNAEDVSAKERRYRLAKHALLDEPQPFADLLRLMIEAKEIPLDDVASWPLFRTIRNTEPVKALLALLDEDAKTLPETAAAANAISGSGPTTPSATPSSGIPDAIDSSKSSEPKVH